MLRVTAGPNTGLETEVGTAPVVIGRGREAELCLADLRVSRRHVLVERVDGPTDSLRLTVLRDAAPIVVAGSATRECVIEPGSSLSFGSSIVTLERRTTSASLEGDATIESLFGGAGPEVASLTAIYALALTLDAATDEHTLSLRLSAWARTHANVETTSLSDGVMGPDLVLTDLAEDRTEVAAGGGGTNDSREAFRRIHFVLDMPRARVAEPLLRLLAVAARIALGALTRIQKMQSLATQNIDLRAAAVGTARVFLGDSEAARRVVALIPRLARSSASALLLGETGTGKSFVARLIHESSGRAAAPFKTVNCAAIPEALFESELFGHERGAFTGALTRRQGILEAAADGTLFLDEVGELSPTLQAKLLRVLEERVFELVGTTRSLPFRARVIAATNRDLESMSREGRLRADLFFRLSVVTMTIPPLRDRGEDTLVLARHLAHDLAAAQGRGDVRLAPAAAAAIAQYAWPGNVRELRNAIERALVMSDGNVLELDDFGPPLTATPDPNVPGEPDLVRLPQRLDLLEKRAIESALRATGDHQARAAGLLGINRVTLYKKLRRLSDAVATDRDAVDGDDVRSEGSASDP